MLSFNDNSQKSNKSSSSGSIKKRRSFSISFKLMAIRKFNRIGSLRKTSRLLGINRKTLRRWIKDQVSFYYLNFGIFNNDNNNKYFKAKIRKH